MLFLGGFILALVCVNIKTVVGFPHEHQVLRLGYGRQHVPELSDDGLSSLPLLSGADKLLRSGPDAARQNRDDSDNERDDEDSTDATTTATTRQGFQNAMERVKDYGGGVLGIVGSAATLNLKGILHGSTQFIPPHIRVGVEDILGAIIGSPLDPNRAVPSPDKYLVTSPATPVNLTTEIIDADYENFFSNRTVAPVPTQPDLTRIPIAETEATTTTTAKTLLVPVQSSESIVVVNETTPVEPEHVSETAVAVTPDVDDNDDSEEDDDNRSLLNLI